MNPGFRSLMWYLLVGTRGGPNRLRILEALRDAPANAHQLSTHLALDYRTIRHHLRLLEQNGAVVRVVRGVYAPPYELSPYLADHFDSVCSAPPVKISSSTREGSSRSPATRRHGFSEVVG